MTDLLAQMDKIIKMYRDAVAKKEYDLSAGLAVDIGLLARDLQEWSENKLEESR